MKAWRLFFLFAGVFNVLAGTAGFFFFERHLVGAGLPAPAYRHPFQLLFLVLVIFGIGYLMVWRDPRGRREIVVLGLLTKIAGLFVSLHALRVGELPAANAWQPWVADFPWILAFSAFLYQTRHRDPNAPPG